MNFKIVAPDNSLTEQISHKIDTKTKPIGSLGRLESIAEQICLIQHTLTPLLNKPVIMVFAADHGLAKENVSAYPQEVTHQMVLNFIHNGAAINAFCNQNEIELKIVDAGVNHDFGEMEGLINRKIEFGTKNALHNRAMSHEQFEKAIAHGVELTKELHKSGTNIVGFGEMGIGNTSSASLIMSYLCGLPISSCIGRGTGLDDSGLTVKIETLTLVKKHHGQLETVPEVMQAVGGFEISMMMGAMLQAAEMNMVIMVDGFIATSAFLAAQTMYPEIINYAIFSHCSDESGHLMMLEHLNAQPILDLNLRLGEGTGCAIAYPIIQCGISFLNQMASFESAGVTDK